MADGMMGRYGAWHGGSLCRMACWVAMADGLIGRDVGWSAGSQGWNAYLVAVVTEE